MTINSMRIEEILATRNMTKTALAKACGVSRQNVSTIIRRGTCEPRTAGKLAAGLGVNVADIVRGGRMQGDSFSKNSGCV